MKQQTTEARRLPGRLISNPHGAHRNEWRWGCCSCGGLLAADAIPWNMGAKLAGRDAEIVFDDWRIFGRDIAAPRPVVDNLRRYAQMSSEGALPSCLFNRFG